MIRRLIVLLILAVLAAACREEEPTSTPPPRQSQEDLATKSPGIPVETPATDAATDAAQDVDTDTGPGLEQETAGDEVVERSINYDWAPGVVQTSPAAGEELALDGAITILFDQPMDQESVVDSFSLSDAASSQKIEGDFHWQGSDTVVFSPSLPLQLEKQYEVLVEDSARGRNGKPIREPVLLQVQTVGFLGVSQTIPAANSSEITTDAAIIVAFNRPVVPLVSTSQQGDLPQPMELEPPVEGVGQWLSTSIYQFTPDLPLAGASQYSDRIPAGLTDVTGGELEEEFGWTFTTVGPAVVSSSIADGATGLGPSEPISVTFNMPMAEASTESAISLNPSVPLNYEWANSFKSVTLTPQVDLELDEEYELTVGVGAQSANGTAPLDESASLRFSTVPFPRIISTDPPDGDVAHRFQSGASVHFASPMDLESFQNQLEIVPEPEDVNLFMTDEGKRLFVGFDLDPYNEYEITIPGTAADPYGNALGSSYTWNFITPPSSPLVSFNLPSRVSQLSTSHPSDIDVIYRNVSQIDVNLYEVNDSFGDLVYTNVNEYIPRGRPIRSWTLPAANIPEAVDTVSISLGEGGSLEPGFYFLRAQAPEIEAEQLWWQNQANTSPNISLTMMLTSPTVSRFA